MVSSIHTPNVQYKGDLNAQKAATQYISNETACE